MQELESVQTKNSWYLKTGLSTHHFLCQCGRVDQYKDEDIKDLSEADVLKLSNKEDTLPLY